MVTFPNFDLPRSVSGASDTWDNNAGAIISSDFFEIATIESQIKRWNGSAWVNGTLKKWNGSVWQEITLKRFNGSIWI